MNADPSEQFRSGSYEPGMLQLWDSVLATFYRGLGAPAGSRLLDVGCGRGLLVALARDDGVEAYGVEPFWPDPVDPRVSRAVAEALPFSDGTFDLVVSFSVIEYVDRPVDALREMARVLRPGARAVVAVPELERYGVLRRDRYRHVTSERWLRTMLPSVPALRLHSVRGLGIRYLVPIGKRTLARVVPALASRLLAFVYARGYPRALADLSICTLERT